MRSCACVSQCVNSRAASSLFLLRTDETKVVPVAISMLGWDEHWLFGTAIAKAATSPSPSTATDYESFYRAEPGWQHQQGERHDSFRNR